MRMAPKTDHMDKDMDKPMVRPTPSFLLTLVQSEILKLRHQNKYYATSLSTYTNFDNSLTLRRTMNVSFIVLSSLFIILRKKQSFFCVRLCTKILHYSLI